MSSGGVAPAKGPESDLGPRWAVSAKPPEPAAGGGVSSEEGRLRVRAPVALY